MFERKNCARTQKLCVHAKNYARTQKIVHARKKMCMYAKNCVRTHKIVYALEKLCLHAKWFTQESCEEGGFWPGNYASH